MSLVGKISSEIGIHTTAAKFFNLVSTKLYLVQNLTDRIHVAKLHRGQDWHHNESVKHWTYVIDGKVTTCQESVESIDEANKTITYKLFNGDIDLQFKLFKFIVQAIDKDQGGAIVKWTIEYERVSEEVDPPYGYVEFVHKCATGIDGYLVKA